MGLMEDDYLWGFIGFEEWGLRGFLQLLVILTEHCCSRLQIRIFEWFYFATWSFYISLKSSEWLLMLHCVLLNLSSCCRALSWLPAWIWFACTHCTDLINDTKQIFSYQTQQSSIISVLNRTLCMEDQGGASKKTKKDNFVFHSTSFWKSWYFRSGCAHKTPQLCLKLCTETDACKSNLLSIDDLFCFCWRVVKS